MKVLKNIFSQFHTFFLWAMASVLLWGWVYTFVGDTTRDKKVTVFVNAPAVEGRALSLHLEEELPEGIKMIRVHDFNYDMFGTNTPGDIYIVPESQLRKMLEEQQDKILPCPVPEGCEALTQDGKAYGIRIYDAAEGVGAGDGIYFRYVAEDPASAEDYYLCFGAETYHLDGAENAVDNAAWEVALQLLALDHK